jgi:hypothetical protein
MGLTTSKSSHHRSLASQPFLWDALDYVPCQVDDYRLKQLRWRRAYPAHPGLEGFTLSNDFCFCFATIAGLADSSLADWLTIAG